VHLRRAAAAAAQAQTIHVLAGCLVIRTGRAGLAYKESSGRTDRHGTDGGISSSNDCDVHEVPVG
jgi:hypothetical protein